jgi:hypothetical protein
MNGDGAGTALRWLASRNPHIGIVYFIHKGSLNFQPHARLAKQLGRQGSTEFG